MVLAGLWEYNNTKSDYRYSDGISDNIDRMMYKSGKYVKTRREHWNVYQLNFYVTLQHSVFGERSKQNRHRHRPKTNMLFYSRIFFIHVLTAIKWACGCGEKQFIKSLVTKLSASKDWRYLRVFLTRIGDMKIEVYISKIVLYENQNGNFLKSNDENLRSFSMLRPEYSVIAQSWHSTLT